MNGANGNETRDWRRRSRCARIDLERAPNINKGSHSLAHLAAAAAAATAATRDLVPRRKPLVAQLDGATRMLPGLVQFNTCELRMLLSLFCFCVQNII